MMLQIQTSYHVGRLKNDAGCEISNDIIVLSIQLSDIAPFAYTVIALSIDWHYSVLLDWCNSIIEVNESNTKGVNRSFSN